MLQYNNRALAAFLEIQASANPFLKIIAAGDPPTDAASGGVMSGNSAPNAQRDAPGGLAGPNHGAADPWDMEGSVAARSDGLFEHVRRQIDLSMRDPRQKAIACFMTEALEPSGWLGKPVAKIAAEGRCRLDEVEAVLEILQGFEPAGLFARSLSECLRLQATDAGILSDTLALVLDNLEMVGRGDIDGLALIANTSPEAILAEVRTIRGLNPKPGATFDCTPIPIAPPDLLASRIDGDWHVELNRSTLPTIRVEGDNNSVSEQTKILLTEAQWLEKAVARRNVTTLTIAAEIVRRQREFLVNGPSHLVPMSIADIAVAVGVHESTVSRVTAGLMMATPRETVRVRDFFSGGLPGKSDGDSVSSVAVREEIRRMIGAEDACNPVSDAAIAAHFKGRGVAIARRTVAKYRDMLAIPGSAERRQRAGRSRRRNPG